MAMFHTNVLDNQIKALPTIATASGAVATFTTDKAENLVDCEVQIVAVQSGSGTPSPTNPRAISGFSACNLSHSDADTSNPTVYNIPFGQTIYGGVLNVGTGVLRVTHLILSISSANYYSSATNKFIVNLVDNAVGYNGDNNCSVYSKSNVNNLTTMPDETYICRQNFVVFRDDTYDNDLSGFISFMSDKQFIYELETPQIVQLDSKTIKALLNENNIWSDTGDIIDLKFVLSVGSYVNQNV